MADSLGKLLREKLANQGTPTGGPGPVSETQRAQEVLRGRSGKAGAGGSGPRISSFGEQAAQAETAIQSKKLQQQGQRQAQWQEMQGAEQAQRFDLQQRQAAQAADIFQEQADMKLAALKEQERQADEKLDVEKQRSTQEQVGFLLNLSQKEYLDELFRNGQMRRWDESSNLQLELKRSGAAFLEQLMRENAAFDRMLAVDEGEFRKEMARMTGEDALAVLKSAVDASNARAAWEAIGEVGGAGVSAGIKKYKSTSQEKDNGRNRRKQAFTGA